MSSIFKYYELIERSGLFDPLFYLRTYPDVAKANMDPLAHYLEMGAREGRNPSAAFDADFYLRECQGIGLVPDNPLVHFIREGSAKGLRPKPNGLDTWPAKPLQTQAVSTAQLPINGEAVSFDATTRAEIRGLLQSAFVDDAMVLEKLGRPKSSEAAAALYLHLPIASRPSLCRAFDRIYYLTRYADVAAASLDPLLHFLSRGCAEGRSPHPLIDLAHIRAQDIALLPHGCGPDTLWEVLQYDLADPSPYFRCGEYRAQLAREGTQAHGLLLHFLEHGCRQGLRPSRYLDVAWYAKKHADGYDPEAAIRHFVLFGDRLAASPSPEFSGQRYLLRHQDVAAASLPPLLHYLLAGEAESRRVFSELTPSQAQPGIASGNPEDEMLGGAARYEALRERLTYARQSAREAIKAKAPIIFRLSEKKLPLNRIRLPKCAKPKVSIVVPAFNQPRHTVECLLSICRHCKRTRFEVILADDASTDPEMQGFAAIQNLVYLRQPSNVGFLENCNRALAHCRGEYILLLNNDAQLLPDAVDALVDVLDADRNIAAAGPKILYPDGRLQEAGCFIDRRGVSTMIGLFGNADLREFNYARDVHYCSGAALLIRRSELGQVLFDSQFAPAYCEDADLCLQFLARGLRVRYCPSATVVHHLSLSTEGQSGERRLRLVASNQQKLLVKWAPLLERLNQLRIICFYLPQFHTTPENDFNWGQGFTEWTNVSRARPTYQAHYQPHLPADLGFYDLRVKQNIQRQTALARRYGIAGFCVYYYNFGGRRALYEAFEAVVADPAVDFPFMVCWANENWTRRWDGGTRQIIFEQRYDLETLEAVVADVIRYARDSRYLTVDGKPMFAVYRPMLIPDLDEFVGLCRARFGEAGFPGVHLVFVDGMETATKSVAPSALGFDACIEFPPHGDAVDMAPQPEALSADFAGHVYDYDSTIESRVLASKSLEQRYPAVFPGWDNTPRQPGKGDSFPNNSPEAFQVYIEEKLEELQQKLMGEHRMLFINAWNEWAEGAHLEPDQRYGHRWLEAVRNAMLARHLL